jgi:Cyclin-dependent kinase inhibitor 3 (CDKN3)
MNQQTLRLLDRDWPDHAPTEIIPNLWMGGYPLGKDGFGNYDPSYEGFDLVIDLDEEAPDLADFGGIMHLHWPIDDGYLMPDTATATALGELAATAVRHELKTLIHCYAGLNRSGLITALALIALGHEPRAAIALIRERRSAHALFNRTFARWLLRDEKPIQYLADDEPEGRLTRLWNRLRRRNDAADYEPWESALEESERLRWNARFTAAHQDLTRFEDDGGPAHADAAWWQAALDERDSYADAYQARLERDELNYSAARARSRWEEIRGDLDAAARECPHDGGYPLRSLAAEYNDDPNAGEDGVRCHDCGSRLTTWPWHNGVVLAPCEFKADESAA